MAPRPRQPHQARPETPAVTSDPSRGSGSLACRTATRVSATFIGTRQPNVRMSRRQGSNDPRGSVSRCLRDGVAPLATLPTTVRLTIHAQRDRLVVEPERGVAETGTQAADAPTAETLRHVREVIPRGVSHGRHRTGSCGMVLRARFGSSADRNERSPPGSRPPS